MLRSCLIALLLLAGLACLAAKPVTVTIVLNGKTVTVPVIESNGKAYLDIATLMKLLGGSATYNAATHKVVISTTAPAAANPGANPGAKPGTVQLAGDNGQLGNVYSIRKDSPLYFRLKSAEFTITPMLIGDDLIIPKADEKLLVLNFSVQNPNPKSEQLVRFDSLHFTVVDANNANHECDAHWGNVETHQKVEVDLKPAQTLDMYTVIQVPAKGTIPKLMVLPGYEGNGPILRYDLRGKITGLAAPVADPADATGATALETIPAQVGATCPFGYFDATVEGFSYTTEKLLDEAPNDGDRFLVVTMRCKNRAASPQLLRFDTFNAQSFDTDGGELEYGGNMLLGSANRKMDQEVQPGQETRVRIYFTVPNGSTPSKLTMKEEEGHSFEFEIK